MTARDRMTDALAEAFTLDGWTRYHCNPAMAQVGAAEAMRTVGPVLDQLLWEHGLLPVERSARDRDRLGARLVPVAGELVEALRPVLLRHHPIMRSETGPFSGCRCGQVRLGQDVIAHVIEHLSAAMNAPDAGYAPTCQDPHKYDSDGLQITVHCEQIPNHVGPHVHVRTYW